MTAFYAGSVTPITTRPRGRGAAPPGAPPPSADSNGGLREVRARAVRGAFSVGLRNLLVRAISLVGMIVLARILAPRDFGLLALGFTVKSVSEMIATGGLAAGLIRREAPPTRAELRAALGFQLTSTTAVVAAIAGAGFLFGGAAWVAAIMALSLPLFALRVPTIVMLERRLDWSLTAKVEILETVVYFVTSLGLVMAGAGVWGVAAAASVQALVGSALLIARGPVGMLAPSLAPALVRPMLRFGVQFQAVPLLGAARDQGVNLVVAAVGGVVTLGLWSAAYRLLQTILMLLQSLWRVSYPAMARALETGADMRRTLEQILRVSSVLVGLPVVIVAASADALVRIIFGPEWHAAAAALPWGAAAILLHGPVSTASSGFLQARGEVGRVLVTVGVQAALWIAGAAIFIAPLGPEGVGVGMFAGSAVYWILIVRFLRAEEPVRAVRSVSAAVTAATIAAVAGHEAGAVPSSTWVSLLASAGTGSVLYLVLLYVIRRSDLSIVWSAVKLARA
jgi:O-antigen/teichoic acid export membrane protein